MSLSPSRRAALDAVLAADPDWQALLRHFDLSHGFSFVVLLVDSRENAELCREALAAHLAGGEKSAIQQIMPATPEEFRDLPNRLYHPIIESSVRALWIEAVVTEGDPDFEEWRKTWRTTFARLNPLRNIMQEAVPCDVIFAGAPWVQVAIREAAPDWWSVRSAVTRVSPRIESDSEPVLDQIVEQGRPSSTDAPDPEFALEMAAPLRGVEGKELQLADLLRRAARGFYARYQIDKAIDVLEEAFSILERAAPESQEFADCASQLGWFYLQAHRTSEAESMLRRSLELSELAFGSSDPHFTASLSSLASLLKDRRPPVEAERMMRRALEIDERTFGTDHPRVAFELNNLAQILARTDRFAEAESMMRRALEIGLKRLGPDHPDVGTWLNNLAGLLRETKRLEEAERLIRRSLSIAQENFGPDHPDVGLRLNNLARLLAEMNRLSEAEPLMRRSLEILSKFLRETGFRGLNLSVALANYELVLSGLGLCGEEVEQRIRSLDLPAIHVPASDV